MATLINKGIFNGDFLADNLEVISTESQVELIDGLTATKTANKTQWANGELEYTIVINNESATDFVTPILTDEINITLATLVTGSVTVDDVVTPYDFTAGILTVELPTVPAGKSLTIKFKVVRV